MAAEILELAKEGVSFLIHSDDEDKAVCPEIESSLEKLAKEVSDFIDLRAAIFMQKEEKIQQYQHDQLVKLKNEEEQYVSKCQAMENNKCECISQLRQLEYSYFDIKKKLGNEEEINMNLKEEITRLKTKNDNVKNSFQKTLSLYLKVIEWYESCLNIHIEIDKENPQIVTFYFGNQKSLGSDPFVKLEAVGDSMFKVLEAHSEVTSDKENIHKLYNTREIISYLYDTRESLRNNRNSMHKVSSI